MHADRFCCMRHEMLLENQHSGPAGAGRHYSRKTVRAPALKLCRGISGSASPERRRSARREKCLRKKKRSNTTQQNPGSHTTTTTQTPRTSPHAWVHTFMCAFLGCCICGWACGGGACCPAIPYWPICGAGCTPGARDICMGCIGMPYWPAWPGPICMIRIP